MHTIFQYMVPMTAVSSFFGIMIWLAVRPIRSKRYTRRALVSSSHREWLFLLLFCYLVGVFLLTLTPNGFWHSVVRGTLPVFPEPFCGEINLIPFRQSILLLEYYIQHHLWYTIWINFPGNVFLFLPLGTISALLMNKPKWWKSTLLAFFLSLLIEFCQLFVSRGTDIDDLILNTLGGSAGYGLFVLLHHFYPYFVQKFRCSKKGWI